MSNPTSGGTTHYTKLSNNPNPAVIVQMVEGKKVMMPANAKCSNEKVVLHETSHPNLETVFIQQEGNTGIKACNSASRIVSQPCASPACETVSFPVHRMIMEFEIITEQEVCPPSPKPLIGKIREIEYEVPVRNMQPSVVEIVPPTVEITATSQEYTSQETDVISRRGIVTAQNVACCPQTNITTQKTMCDLDKCVVVEERVSPK